MDARTACLGCLRRGTDALFEAALWIAAEHDPNLQPERALAMLDRLCRRIAASLPEQAGDDRAQSLLRLLNALEFHEDASGPDSLLAHRLLQHRRGQPLMLGLLALELARRLGIPLRGINFPGRFLLRVPGADHLLDPAGGRRLYLRDCRELLERRYRGQIQLNSTHLQPGVPTVADHLARADLYQRLECPPGERYDLQHALLLCEDPGERLRLTERLRETAPPAVVH